MDIVNILRKAESKLKKESDRIANQLASLRSPISALGGKSGRTSVRYQRRHGLRLQKHSKQDGRKRLVRTVWTK